jgi:hypothetical protein
VVADEAPAARQAFVTHLLDRAQEMFPRRSALVIAAELTVGNVITPEEGITYLGIPSSEFRKAIAGLRKRIRQARKHAKHLSHEAEGFGRGAG